MRDKSRRRRRLFLLGANIPTLWGRHAPRKRGIRYSKDRATPATAPIIGPFFYDYTVFAADENFTVTEPNDIKFLEYFYQRCIADDEAAPTQQLKRSPGLISRIFRWMMQPI